MPYPSLFYLRMQRQHLLQPAGREAYAALYRDLQPGMNVYWNGFGQPPVLSFRASFDDLAYNRDRQLARELIKGRFAGGNLGWIVPEDLELFAALYRKPLTAPTPVQEQILALIRQLGPLTIQQIKEETGLLVKEITPALHRLQQAFLLYEDQYDGEWDRSWCRLEEMFPEADLTRLTRESALEEILLRYARRMAFFTPSMAKSFYQLPERQIRAALAALAGRGALLEREGGFLCAGDEALLAAAPEPMRFVRAMHRNDVLCRSCEPNIRARLEPLLHGLPYDHEPLQYLLIDGEFHGACVGRFRNGPYDLNDVVCDLPDAPARREEILAAVREVNFGKSPARFLGREA